MSKTSIVIPLATGGFGSRHNDVELRYCLRSVEKHLKKYGDVFIIGHKPAWLQNVIHIPATDDDKTYWKERNIFRKVLLACQDERVSENFLFMNDDHFLLRDFTACDFPYYAEGWISNHLRHDQYGNTIRNTIAVVGNKACYYDIHCPIIYNKGAFQRLAELNWDTRYGYAIKTVYCEFATTIDIRKGPFYYPDLKIRVPLPTQEIKDLIRWRLFFSVDNRAMEGGAVEAVLKELYPHRSRYEK